MTRSLTGQRKKQQINSYGIHESGCHFFCFMEIAYYKEKRPDDVRTFLCYGFSRT